MEQTSFHGSKIVLSITGLLALTLLTVVGTYRLKKSAEIKRWEKALTLYSLELEQENKLVEAK